MPPLSIYLHWPWCVRKCPYCDFNSHRLPASKADRLAFESAYAAGVLQALEAWCCQVPEIADRPIVSIFVGGGTPSLMSGETVERLLTGIRSRFRLTEDCEITMEANPGTAESEK